MSQDSFSPPETTISAETATAPQPETAETQQPQEVLAIFRDLREHFMKVIEILSDPEKPSDAIKSEITSLGPLKIPKKFKAKDVKQITDQLRTWLNAISPFFHQHYKDNSVDRSLFVDTKNFYNNDTPS